ncbi:MAG: M23 family metallopeptidase [Thiomargarita sp.]|nr:M23 family metallopeptidase [Thiomargarita sp.]
MFIKRKYLFSSKSKKFNKVFTSRSVNNRISSLSFQIILPFGHKNFTIEQGIHSTPFDWFNSKIITIISLMSILPLLWWLNNSDASTPNLSSITQITAFDEAIYLKPDEPLIPIKAEVKPIITLNNFNLIEATTNTAKFINTSKLINEIVLPTPKPTTYIWLHTKVHSGDNLSKIFKRHGFSQAQLQNILELQQYKQILRKLYINQAIHIQHDPAKNVQALVLSIDKTNELYFFKTKQGLYEAAIQKKGIYAKQKIFIHAKIDSSLDAVVKKLGISKNKLLELQQLFTKKTNQQLKSGMQFTFIYELKKFKNDNIEGPILAAQFLYENQVDNLFRYTNLNGKTDYYTEAGYNSNTISLLRVPLNDFTRISSKFGKRRHPISRRYHLHTGVDYAASWGTPVFAAGDATIDFIGRKGGYGKTIALKHNQRVTTLYAHLSKFEELNVGDKVVQGQIIAYVGRSGRTTGSHLHYEIQVDGEYKDAQAIELPLSFPIAKNYYAHFKNKIAELQTQLNKLSQSTASTKLVEAMPTVSPSMEKQTNTVVSIAPGLNNLAQHLIVK